MKKGWQTQTIGDVCDLATGGTPSRAKPEYFGGHIKWLVSGDINQGEIFDCEGRITEAGKKNSNAKLLPVNSVMIALNGQGKTRGTVALLRTQATCNQSMVSISPKPSSGLLPEFLYANLHGRYEEIRRMTSDDDKDRRGLNMGLVRSIKIPIAPLAEQQRIVGLLDEAFEGLATAKANAEKNLQNARALFESHLQSVFTHRGPGWVEKRLEECFRLKSGDGLISSAMKGGKYPVFGGNGIAGMHDEFNLSGDNVIIGRVGALCGNARHITETIWLTDNAFRIVDRSFEFDGAFLTYLLNFKNLRSLARQAAQPVISNSSLKDLLLPFPEIDKQKMIAAQLDDLREETQRLARLYERKQAALEALKKSLLHQAFTGEL